MKNVFIAVVVITALSLLGLLGIRQYYRAEQAKRVLDPKEQVVVQSLLSDKLKDAAATIAITAAQNTIRQGVQSLQNNQTAQDSFAAKTANAFAQGFAKGLDQKLEQDKRAFNRDMQVINQGFAKDKQAITQWQQTGFAAQQSTTLPATLAFGAGTEQGAQTAEDKKEGDDNA